MGVPNVDFSLSLPFMTISVLHFAPIPPDRKVYMPKAYR